MGRYGEFRSIGTQMKGIFCLLRFNSGNLLLKNSEQIILVKRDLRLIGTFLAAKTDPQ